MYNGYLKIKNPYGLIEKEPIKVDVINILNKKYLLNI